MFQVGRKKFISGSILLCIWLIANEWKQCFRCYGFYTDRSAFSGEYCEGSPDYFGKQIFLVFSVYIYGRRSIVPVFVGVLSMERKD